MRDQQLCIILCDIVMDFTCIAVNDKHNMMFVLGLFNYICLIEHIHLEE